MGPHGSGGAGRRRHCPHHSDGVCYKAKGREPDSTATSESTARIQDTYHVHTAYACDRDKMAGNTAGSAQGKKTTSPTPSNTIQSQGTPAILAQPDSTSPSAQPCRWCVRGALGICWHGHASVWAKKQGKQLLA